MPTRAGLRWSVPPSRLAEAVVDYGDNVQISVIEFAETLAELAEGEAKRNAPWKDRTGEARRRLHARVERLNTGAARVVLGHGVDYGIWLEIKQAGRWGIVVKTLQQLAPAWAAFLTRMGF